MAQNTLAQNVETAATVIKEVKEAIIEKGIEIPEGTHATEYPGYIAAMTSKTEFEELEERVQVNEDSIEEIKNVTVWGQELKGNVTGDLSEVNNIAFSTHNKYSVGSKTERPHVIYSGARVSVGDAAEVNDGETGVVLGKYGIVSIAVSEEDTTSEIHPRLRFYYGGATDPTSSIREAYPGTLSVPDKLCVGAKQDKLQEKKLHVEGTSSQTGYAYHQENIYVGKDKVSSTDTKQGVVLGAKGFTSIVSDENPFIDFFRENSAAQTSRIIEGYDGCLSVIKDLNVGGTRTTAPGYTFNVNGTGNVTNAFTATTINGVPLTAKGEGSQFLADDGVYHDLQLDNYLPTAEGSMLGKLWMSGNKIHFGTRGLGVAGISYEHDHGVYLESATGLEDSNPNIELYAQGTGDIVLNPTEGKALYKDTELATVEDVSTVNTRVDLLESLIGELNNDLENVLNGN